MVDLHSVAGAQAVLIGFGVALQLAARVASRTEVVEPPAEKMPRRVVPKVQMPRPNSAQLRPSARSKDYYEMERTPQGVRPGDLAKTAKVKYVQDITAPSA
jgi:hypothetical protein